MHPEKLSHYDVQRLIGAGGMGEVYLAHDATLDRKVALKLLPARFTEDEERVRRFKREARAASALNHPNIITIYEIGEVDSVHFIATEFIEGTTLREAITGRSMTIAEVLDVAISVASALGAAHDAGIIHRDIKPENIMLRPDGYVKILDFGLAKLVDDASMKDSSTGAVMGTLLYISPEQARGQQPDARSDLYALGAVMYELLAKRPPIVGDNFLEMAMAIANRRPDPPSAVVPGIPPELDRIVLKALAKEPSQRYATARQMLADLRMLRQQLDFETLYAKDPHRYSTPGVGQQPTMPMTFPPGSSSSHFIRMASVLASTRMLVVAVVVLALIAAGMVIAARYDVFGADRIDSVAVLPFVNASGNVSSEYLSDGLSESITDSLAKLPHLQVMARSTVFRFKGKPIDPLSVGRELHVRGVVTGQLLQRGDTLVIRATLTDVKRGTQVWGEQYERKLSDVLALQKDLAETISAQLRQHMSGEEKALLTKSSSVDSQAFQDYLKGRYFAMKYNEPEQIRRGIAYYQQAIERDPSYAMAWAGLAEAYYNLSNLHMAPREAMPRVREAAKRALALDDSLAAAHASLALVQAWYDWDFAAAEREFRRAIELNPNDVDAHTFYGDFLTATGEFDRAVAEQRKAELLDPLSINTSWAVARTLFFAGRYDEALAQIRRTRELDDRFAYTYYIEAQIALFRHNLPNAFATTQRALELGGPTQLLVTWRGYLNARAGNRAEALKAIEDLKHSDSYTTPLLLARIYAGLGDNDQAMAWLEKVYADRSESVVWLKVDPTFEPMRRDPRFAALLARVSGR